MAASCFGLGCSSVGTGVSFRVEGTRNGAKYQSVLALNLRLLLEIVLDVPVN